MGGDDKQTSTSTQTATTNPWDAARPLLDRVLSAYGSVGTGVTGGQQTALDNLTGGVANIPNFGSTASDAISKMFGMNTDQQIGMLNAGYGTLQNNLGGTASGAELNPYDTPGFADALNTATNDITKAVKGVYAGSGRDPSGAGSFAGSLGRGLTQGLAPTIAAQFNQNKANQMNAAGTLFNAAGSTASGITNQQSLPLQMAAQSIGLLPSAATAYGLPGAAQLSAANTAYGLPYQNIAQLLQPALALGGMGSQSYGSGTSETSQPQSMMGNIMGGLMGGTGLLSQMGAFGPAGWLLASDENVKTDIEKVGKLNDGQDVVRYRYKGSPVTQIGLLAQDVQRRKPAAVGRMRGGMLGVDYKRATDDAARRAA